MKIVEILLKQGYAYPCACCERLWENYSDNIGVCTAKKEGVVCGGPIAGLAFPAYKGPLTRDNIIKSCFRCGKPADKIIETTTGFFGSCKEHLKLVIPECVNALEVDQTNVENNSILKK